MELRTRAESARVLTQGGQARVARRDIKGKLLHSTSLPDGPEELAADNVLVVDDDATVRMITRRMLVRGGSKCVTLVDGCEVADFLGLDGSAGNVSTPRRARAAAAGGSRLATIPSASAMDPKALQGSQVTLVLLDIVMRHSDGAEVCAALRAQGCTLPIYAMTGNVDASNEERCRHAGFDGLLAKPFNLTNVQAVRNHATSVRQWRHASTATHHPHRAPRPSWIRTRRK